MIGLDDDRHAVSPGEATVAWQTLVYEATDALAAAGVTNAGTEARWLVEEASGMDRTELVRDGGSPATVGGVARLDAMVARRAAGEPIQYVLGHWGFRSLDLLVDGRVLIPRPETEQVVEAALAALDAMDRRSPTVVDLGTGSGAIALAIASERRGADVWATDRSADAVSVARANLAGLGMAGSRVRVLEGSWFDPLPAELEGAVDLVVTNPPYVAASDPLPTSVSAWEPAGALVSGDSGLEAYEQILARVPRWLAPGGAVVAEIGATQGADVRALLADAGFGEVRIERDHAGRDRIAIASWA